MSDAKYEELAHRTKWEYSSDYYTMQLLAMVYQTYTLR